MKKLSLLILLTTYSCITYAQESSKDEVSLLNVKGDYGGMFSLGARTTFSVFNGHDDEGNGLGMGGQFRLQFSDRVNSDWFFDYIRSDIGDFANRTDYHIGWSVLFYPTPDPQAFVRPYILAGHCFDYTRIAANGSAFSVDDRWSSAVQGGLGVHFNLTPRFDLSLVGQYMMHLGNELNAHLEDGMVVFEESGGASSEGHMLFHVGLNYKIGDLW